MIQVKNAGHKGRGVFAQKDFRKGQIIEICPALNCLKSDWQFLSKTSISQYVFDWGDGTAALALGLGSLYNHSETKPNAETEVCTKTRTITYRAIRKIKKGEEILFDYGYSPDGYDPNKD